jgi:hypothetical protein
MKLFLFTARRHLVAAMLVAISTSPARACEDEGDGRAGGHVWVQSYSGPSDAAFYSSFGACAAIAGVDPSAAVADARAILSELDKPYSDKIDMNATIDRPSIYLGVVRHLRSGRIRRLGEDGEVAWLTGCHKRSGHIVNCEIWN